MEENYTEETVKTQEEPTVSEQSIIDTLFKEKKQYEEATKDQRQETKDIYSAYMGKMDEVKNVPYKSKETIPKLRTEVSYVKPFIFSGNPEIEIEGVGDEDKTIAKILEKIVNYRIQQSIPNAYDKIEAWVGQSVTFGTSIIKVVWRFKTKKVKDETTGQEYEEPILDAPDLEVPNILDTYKNPILQEIKDQHCLIFRSVLTLEEVRNNPAYDYMSEGQEEPNRLRVRSKSNFQINQYDSSSQIVTDIPHSQDATDGLIEIYERVTADRIQTVADGQERLVLRDTAHNYGCINAVKFIFEPNAIPNRFDGLGVGHNTLGLGKLYFQMFNQTLEGVKMTNNPMFLFEKGNGIDPKQLVAKPGGGIAVDKDNRALSDKIVPVQFPDVKAGAIDILNKIDDEHKRASGANDLMQGSTSNDTLGQDEIAQANTSNRFELIVRRFKQSLAEVAEIMLKMELENLQSPDAEILRIFPQEARMQIYEVLVSEGKNVKYNIKVKGETNIAQNKNLSAKRLIEMFNLGAAFLTDQEKRAFLRRMAEMQGVDNIDEIVGETNPMMQQQEAMQAMQVEQGMMPMGAETAAGLNQGARNLQ